MIKEITSEKLPIKLWLDDIEDGALAQTKNLANLPFAFHHIAIMPDSHQGYGMPIGGVLATKGVIIPNAVGVDIGCGMCAINTGHKDLAKDDIKKVMGFIREFVPVGFAHNKEPISGQEEIYYMPRVNPETSPICNREYQSARYQLGTLGGGNHFIEIQRADDGFICVMIHSGSRNFGKQVADHYNKLAIEKNYFNLDPKLELCGFPVDSPEGILYQTEMDLCIAFGHANRMRMMQQIMYAFEKAGVPMPQPSAVLNIAHNYANEEEHFGEKVIVHRKGAVCMMPGIVGIIPGSQGTKSYLVVGDGNPESFNSCSHGAGRKMGRNQAKKNLNLEEEIKKMDDQGIIHGIRSENDLDEAAGAYKDIDVVMKNQEDLVKPILELTPLAVIKG